MNGLTEAINLLCLSASSNPLSGSSKEQDASAKSVRKEQRVCFDHRKLETGLFSVPSSPHKRLFNKAVLTRFGCNVCKHDICHRAQVATAVYLPGMTVLASGDLSTVPGQPLQDLRIRRSVVYLLQRAQKYGHPLSAAEKIIKL